jgi:hypothetical protein
MIKYKAPLVLEAQYFVTDAIAPFDLPVADGRMR